MYKYSQTISDTFKDKDGSLQAAKYFYGSQFMDDHMFKNPDTLPLYGHLARKVLMHYAGDHYNPHMISITQEPFMRMLIKSFVEYKVFYKIKDYDWEFLDHFFRKVVDDYYTLGLDYDNAIIERGFKPEFTAPRFVDYDKTN